jgi:hypothetical protein
MAREVDPVTKLLLDKKLPQGMDHDVFMWFLKRFEALVRADERDDILRMSGSQWFKSQARYDEAIRARGETK